MLKVNSYNLLTLSVPDEVYYNLLTSSVPDEVYYNLLTLSIPDEVYYQSQQIVINFIRYAQSQQIGKPNNFKILGARKLKALNRLPKLVKVTYALTKIFIKLFSFPIF
jgi:hypothetical protein